MALAKNNFSTPFVPFTGRAEKTDDYEKDIVPSTDFESNEMYSEIVPFDPGEIALKYTEFWHDWENSIPPISEAEIQLFLDRAGVPIGQSKEALDQIAALYRSLGKYEVVQRSLITDLLVRSDTGLQQLLIEADHINNTENEALYSEMFNIYSNLAEDIDGRLVEKATNMLKIDGTPGDVASA